VGIDEDKIPISQQQINIPRMTSLSHLPNQNAPEETGHRQDPLIKPSTSQTHTRNAQACTGEKVVFLIFFLRKKGGLSHCAQHPPTICKASEFHQIRWPNTIRVNIAHMIANGGIKKLQ